MRYYYNILVEVRNASARTPREKSFQGSVPKPGVCLAFLVGCEGERESFSLGERVIGEKVMRVVFKE
jgi:hypothetical protein